MAAATAPAARRAWRIYTDGACANNHCHGVVRRAGYGIYIEPCDGGGGGAVATPPPAPVAPNVPSSANGDAPWCLFAPLPPAEDGAGTPLTNNRAEMSAVLRVLELLRVPGATPVAPHDTVLVLCDNTYTVRTLNEWLRRWTAQNYMDGAARRLNADLLRRLAAEWERPSAARVRIAWMRGHTAEPPAASAAGGVNLPWRDWYGNQVADLLAGMACGENAWALTRRRRKTPSV